MISLLTRAGLATFFVVGALVSTHAQAPSPLVFEPGFEGEIWQALPKIGKKISSACVPNWEPVLNDDGSYAGWDVPLYGGDPVADPDMDGNLCTPAQVPLDEMLFPHYVALYSPDGQTLGANGFPPIYYVYVTDLANHRVLTFRPDTNGEWVPVALPGADWNGEATANLPEPMALPHGIDVDAAGNVWVTDILSNRVLVFAGANEVTEPGRLLATIQTDFPPYGIKLSPGSAYLQDGRVAYTQEDFAEPFEQEIVVVDTATLTEVDRIGSPYGNDLEQWANPVALAYHTDSSGTLRLVVNDAYNSRIKVLDLDANGVPLPTPALVIENAAFSDPDAFIQEAYGVAVDRRGRVLVGDTANQRMSVFKLDFTPGSPAPVQYLYQLNADGGLNGFPRGIVEDPFGRLLIVDTSNHELEVLDIPGLAIVDVAVSPVPGRPTKPVNVDFSVVVPETKYQVVDMTPTCQVTDGATTTVLTPIPIDGTDSTLPLPSIQPLEVARYRCIYTPAGGTTLEFDLGASGNTAGTTNVTAAPSKVATSVVIDCTDCEETPPTVSAVVSSPAPVNGFYSTAATVTITATDPEPAGQTTPGQVKRIYWQWFGAMVVAPIPPSLRCPGEPAGVQCVEFAAGGATESIDVSAPVPGRSTLRFWADDGFDNKSAVGELTFTIDTLPPTVTFVHTPEENAHGWWNAQVTIAYTLADNWTQQADIAIVPPSIPQGTVVSSEGAGQTFSVTAQDLAGNSATFTTTINLDGVAPTTTASATSALSGPRTVTLSATDGLSGVEFTVYSLSGATTQGLRSYASPIELTTPGTTVVTFYSLDYASNAETPQSLEVFVNGTPTARDDTAAVDEDTTVVIPVLANDTDPNVGDVLTPAIVTPAPNGTAVVNADGTITYSPSANFNGTTSFTYRVSDAQGVTSAAATVTITVRPVNDAPTAAPDSATTAEDAAVAIAVLANDTDIDGDTLAVQAVTLGAHGSVQINGDGTVTYTPQPNFNGSDTFSYTVSDGHGGTATGTVMVTVTPANDPPSAEPDTATTAEDAAVTIAVLANDTDIDGDTLSVQAVTPGAHGAAQINGDGTVTYTPQANFNGPDSFSYTASDGYGGTAMATVSVTVTPLNDPPTAAPDSATTAEDTGTSIPVLANDTDIEGDSLTVSGVTQGAHGAVAVNGDGTVTYTPQANFNGSDSFTYTASDGHGGAATGTVTVIVTPTNDPPSAEPDTATTAEDAAVTIAVLANDADIDGDRLAVQSATPGAHGAVQINGDGSVTYTAQPNFNGSDSFSYTASDGYGGTATALVSVTVTPVNDAPTAAPDSATTAEDTATTISVLANDTDIDGDTLAVQAVTSGAHGSVQINANGTVTYTPQPNFNGSDTFTYTASDGHGGTASATVSLTVTPVDDAPVAHDDVATVTAGQSVTIAVLANDTDVDIATNGDTLTPAIVLQSPNGTAVVNANGTVTFTPNVGFAGVAVFSYRVRDAAGADSNLAIVAVTVRDNNPPVCQAATASPGEIWPPNNKRQYNVTVKGVTDPDGDALTILIARILQDEPVDTTGDGNFTPDGGGLGTSAAWVRAERMGSGNGRIYEIWFTATDSKGDSCTGRVYTTVPKSQGQPWQVIDSGVRYDSTVSVPGTRDQDGDHDQHLPKRKS